MMFEFTAEADCECVKAELPTRDNPGERGGVIVDEVLVFGNPFPFTREQLVLLGEMIEEERRKEWETANA